MPDAISTNNYFSVSVANKPGEASKVLGALKGAGINLKAFWGYPVKGKQAVLDLLPADAKEFVKAAKKLKLICSPKKACFTVEGEDRLGALEEILGKLAAAGINVHAAQAIVAGAGRFGALIQVAEADFRKAKKLLGA